MLLHYPCTIFIISQKKKTETAIRKTQITVTFPTVMTCNRLLSLHIRPDLYNRFLSVEVIFCNRETV